MLPIVRVEATLSFAATTVRVSPVAITRRYSSDLPSAATNSCHGTYSHWP